MCELLLPENNITYGAVSCLETCRNQVVFYLTHLYLHFCSKFMKWWDSYSVSSTDTLGVSGCLAVQTKHCRMAETKLFDCSDIIWHLLTPQHSFEKMRPGGGGGGGWAAGRSIVSRLYPPLSFSWDQLHFHLIGTGKPPSVIRLHIDR